MITINERDRVRFASKTTPAANGCIEISGPRQRSGHIRIWMDGGMRLAHRVAWLMAKGPIPDGLGVLHRCDNPPCVNVDHLFLGTVGDNNADRDRKGRGKPPRVDLVIRQQPGPIKHGTIYAYVRRKCRCDLCRQAKREYDSGCVCDVCDGSVSRSNLSRHRRLVHGVSS